MARKPITRVNGYVLSNLNNRDSIITTLLKRFYTFEEAVDYLLSAVPQTLRDDMLGELSTWDSRPAEMRSTRAEWHQRPAPVPVPAPIEDEAIWTPDARELVRVAKAAIRTAQASGKRWVDIAREFKVDIGTVRRWADRTRQLNENGQCPICRRKPTVRARLQLCKHCGRQFDLITGEQISGPAVPPVS
jgi:transposase-like protein